MAQNVVNIKAHTLHFCYDEDDNCALTTLINDVRFHITIDPKELQKSREKPLYYEYLDKISALREADEREEEQAEKQQARVPRSKAKSKSKGRKGSENSDGKDSGVDIASDGADDEYIEDEDEEAGQDADQDSASAGMELRNWILGAFAEVAKTCAPPNREPEESTIDEWYHGPTYFYSMQVANGELLPELLETTPELEEKIEALVPRMKMPKYIQNYKLPWLNAKDLTVQSEVSMPPPAHPGQVVHKETGDIYFFKPVVAEQPDSVKREINILRKLEKLDLDIKFPHLLGFVSFGTSKREAMGMLLQNIRYPTPLTKLLRSSVDADARAEWSRKSEKYIKALHDNGIIWGDAKADNFMVDADSELWIIDFGGSYTEGWVDPEISETVEGDDMGLEKIQAALEDPDKNTVDPGLADEDEGAEEEKISEGSSVVRETASTLFVTEKSAGEEITRSEKRKRAEEEVEEGPVDEEDDSTRKRRKSDTPAS
jgi:tRNA A-37 threonylcarbamoyl transferase component Bud32